MKNLEKLKMIFSRQSLERGVFLFKQLIKTIAAWDRNTWSIKLDRLIVFLLGGLIFVLPFSKSLIEIFFATIVVFWILKRIFASERGQKISIKTFMPVKTKLNWPIALFVFTGALSTITSISLQLSLEGLFFKVGESVLIYFVIIESIRDKESFCWILKAILLSAAIIALDGLIQGVIGIDIIRFHHMVGNKVQASFGNANDYAGWLVIILPLLLSLAILDKKEPITKLIKLSGKWSKLKIKPTLGIITYISFVCLILTHSRAALAATILSVIFLGILKIRKLIFLVVALLLLLVFTSTGQIKEHVKMFWGATGGSAVIRVRLWQEAFDIIQDYPWLGSGLNTYSTIAPKYVRKDLPKLTENTGGYPHNSYLHMAAESGILGLGAFFLIIASVLWNAISGMKKINDISYRAVLAGLSMGLVAFLIHSFMDTNLYSLQLNSLMWYVIGLIVSVKKIALENNTTIR